MRGLSVLLGLNFQTIAILYAGYELGLWLETRWAGEYWFGSWATLAVILSTVIVAYNWWVVLRWFVKNDKRMAEQKKQKAEELKNR